MADTKYTVELELTKHGDFGLDVAVKKTSDLDKGLSNAKANLSELSSGGAKLMQSLDWAVGKAWDLGKALAMGAGAAAIAGVTYGVMKLNAEAEGAAISIGTIFSAQGMAANVPAGITMAKDQIAKMRIDAQKLPGEFEDLQNIFMTAATPLFQAGATPDQARALSAKVMAGAKVMQVQTDMAAREFAQLLSGRAGAHNVLGTRIGLIGGKAQEFNKLSDEKRLAMLGTEFDKFSGSLDVFATSYEGVSSTFVDNLKNFARLATGGIFDDLKDTLNEVNTWFSKNQNEINSFAAHLSVSIKEAFEWGKAKILEWYPIVERFAGVAYDRLRAFWDEIEPSVEAFGKAMKSALEDPNGTIDKLHDLFVIWATFKGASLAMSAGGGLGGIAKGVGSGIGWLGGAGEAAAGGGAAAGGLGAFGASTVAGVEVGAGVVGAAFLAAVAAWGVAAYEAAGLWDEIHEQTMADTRAIATAHGVEIASMLKAGESMEQIWTTAQDHAADYVDSMDVAGWKLNDMATEAAYASAGLDIFGMKLSGFQPGEKSSANIAEQANRDSGMANFMAVMGKALPNEKTDAALKPKPTIGGGHGGTSIQKVEIVVTSNGDPSRIARVIEQHLSGLSRNKRVSPLVRNYSSMEDG